MLRQRLLTALLLLPPGLFCIFQGGAFYYILFAIFLGLAAHEYAAMMQRLGGRPARGLIIGGVLLLTTAQTLATSWPRLELLSGGALTALLIAATTWHLVDFERGATTAATDWAATVAGIVYLGWLGSYFVPLRALPDGLWWTFIVLPSIWLADSGAYVVGKRWGKHLMTPRLSPKKTWEGFIGGLVWGAGGGALFGWVGSLVIGPTSPITALSGGLLGLLIAFTGVLGDLAISMLKRQAGLKDTSQLLGAHGGLLDRMDSWLVAGPVAYFVIMIWFH
jgi:phosphatidate cytidylyltransferase